MIFMCMTGNGGGDNKKTDYFGMSGYSWPISSKETHLPTPSGRETGMRSQLDHYHCRGPWTVAGVRSKKGSALKADPL